MAYKGKGVFVGCNSSLLGVATGTDPAVDPPYNFRPFRVMVTSVAALALYWFFFVMGGTFDSAKRAGLTKVGEVKKAALPTARRKHVKQNTENSDATLHPMHANKRGRAVHREVPVK